VERRIGIARPSAGFATIKADMRTAEWIHIVVFSFFVSLAWVRALPGRRRANVTGIGFVGLGATLTGACLLPRLCPPLAVSVVRDWLPAALVLLVYWQAGEFFLRVDERLQDRLERIDQRIVAPLMRWLSRRLARKWIAVYLELSYLLCYPMIPMSVGALYLLGLARHADYFWTVVLVSTYLSYGMLPFMQTLPPRMLAEPWLDPLPPNPVRAFNLWILRHASIHANTFPSAHVAASTGAALVLTVLAPWPAGLLFVAIASGIAVGTFAGRYHFAADAIAGTAVATIVFLAATWIGTP
jgi:PAP2 superfamily